MSWEEDISNCALLGYFCCWPMKGRVGYLVGWAMEVWLGSIGESENKVILCFIMISLDWQACVRIVLQLFII